jgi:hypothetical protein
MKHRRSSIACMTAAVPPTAGRLVTSERVLEDFNQHTCSPCRHVGYCSWLITRLGERPTMQGCLALLRNARMRANHCIPSVIGLC